jgi:hypothetical protein
MHGSAARGLAWERVERQASFHECVEEDTECPCVSRTPVIGLPEEDLWRGIVFATASCA